ncbi:MAG: DUF2092 domain-containing protein [Deltaproteobacteria bacterium]|nr:DUF2092 domain-containing protein [Deltaproteobacteria bacterium]
MNRSWMGRLRTRLVASGLVLIALPVLLAAGPVLPAGNEKPGAEGAPVVDKQADALLHKMGDTLRQAKAFKFHAEITFDDVLPSGQKIQYAGAMQAFVRRPDRMYVAYQDDLSAKEFWYDGKTATLVDIPHNVYSSVKAGSQIDSALDGLVADYALTLPLSHLAYSQPYDSMMKQVRYGIDLGTHDVGGIACRHLAFVQKNADWQIWIEEGNPVVPRKVVITYKTLPGAPQYSATFTGWDLKAKLADGEFAAVVPKDASQIEFIKVKEAGR